MSRSRLRSRLRSCLLACLRSPCCRLCSLVFECLMNRLNQPTRPTDKMKSTMCRESFFFFFFFRPDLIFNTGTGTHTPSPLPAGKKTPGGAGTHTGHTGHTRAHAGTRITRTNLTTIHPNPTTQTRTKTATDSTAARTNATGTALTSKHHISSLVSACLD